MRATIQQKETTNKKWIIPLIIFIGSILFEYFLGNLLFYHSYHSIIGVQDFLNEEMGLSIFDNSYNATTDNEISPKTDDDSESGKKEKDIGGDIAKFVKDVDGNIIFSEIIHFLNTNTFYIMICAISYNFVNVYKVLVLTNTIFLANFISSTLCFIFHSPRPYMAYFSIKPVIMFNEWGSPNTQVIVLISFYLSFYEIIIRNKKMDNKIFGKIIIFAIIGLIILADIFILFASGNIAYNQIIFSICIGIVTYQIIFFQLKVEVNKSKQLFSFIKFKTRYYIFINVILLAFQFILNIFVIDKYDEDYYTNNINDQQLRLFYSKFLSEHFNYRTIFYLNKGNFCNVICFSMNIVSFLSIKLELLWTYKGDYESWSSYNFEKPRNENGLLDISEDDFIIRDRTQWNHTGCFKAVIRLIFIIIFCLCSMIPSVLIYYFISGNSEINGYIFIITVPMFLLVFGMFYLFKVVLRCFKLAKKH